MAGFLDDNTQRFPHGSIDEIFNIPIGALVLMDYHQSQKVSLLATGTFTVHLIVRAACHILACVCSIGVFQWPLTKDTVIVRMAKRTFAIALPGLLYGLQFPKLVPEIFIENLITILKKFGHYKDLNENQQGYLEDNTQNIWNILRPKIEPIANEALTRLGQPVGKSRFNISARNSCLQRAIRMSAITRLVIDSMVRTGALSSDHLVAFGSETPHEEQVRGVLFASVNVFTCLVDSIELLWIVFCAGIEDLEAFLEGAEIPLHGTRDDIDFCLWSVNEAGLVALLRILMPTTQPEQSVITNEKEEEEENKEKEKEKGKGKGKQKEEGEASTSASAGNNGNV